MFKVNNKDTRTTSMTSFWCLYCYLWTYFTSCSSVSIFNFEHVIAGWVVFKKIHSLLQLNWNRPQFDRIQKALFSGIQCTFKEVKNKRKFSENLGPNICTSFHVCAQFTFITNETELDYYHQRMNVWVVSRVSERVTERRSQEIKEFKGKFLNCLELMTTIMTRTQRTTFNICARN